MRKWILLVSLLLISPALGDCLTYFTGVGCPHCAHADPVVFNLFDKFPNLTIIEYEIYQTRENAPVLEKYCSSHNLTLCGIPLAVKREYIIGDAPIINHINELVSNTSNDCLINLSNLEGKPKIWFKDGIIYYDNGWILEWNGNINISQTLSRFNLSTNYEETTAVPMPISGGKIDFQHAVKVSAADRNKETTSNLTLAKIVSLALVDAVNPCALSVLTLVLLSITTYNPRNKKKVLLAGFAFSLAVLVMYFFYGLVLIRFFQVIQALTGIKLFLYKALGIAAIVLGILEIKDYFHYSPGGIFTEMPLKLRPLAGKIIKGITSPKGAFFTGMFVTVFLLPCTIGPYVITSGLLSAYKLISTIPLLLLYNIIFISPMIGITLIVYAGVSRISDVKEWRKKNVRLLHLIAGIIITVLGTGMTLGLF